MKNQLTQLDIERLRELLDEMKERIDETKRIVCRGPSLQWERAKSYCIAHIEMALSSDHDYLGSDTTLEEVIEELEDSVTAPTCKKCGSPLDGDGMCTDETCPYYDHPQSEEGVEEEQLRRDEKHNLYGPDEGQPF